MTSWLTDLLEQRKRSSPRNLAVQVSEPFEGAIEFIPNTYDTRLLISAGIHGNETAPIELLNDLVEGVLDQSIKVACHTICLIGNPMAVRRGVRFVDVNLNRLFSGAHNGYPDCDETERAEKISRFLASAWSNNRLPIQHYDLHTAIRGSQFEKFAVSPFGQEITETHIDHLKRCGVEALLLSHKPSTTFSFETFSRYGAEAYTVELGKVAPFGENDLDLTLIKQHLQNLMADRPDTRPIDKNLQQFQVVHEVIRSSEQFQLNVSNDTKNFQAFPANTLIATDADNEYRTQRDNERIVFPNPNVPIGQRAGLLVLNKNTP